MNDTNGRLLLFLATIHVLYSTTSAIIPFKHRHILSSQLHAHRISLSDDDIPTTFTRHLYKGESFSVISRLYSVKQKKHFSSVMQKRRQFLGRVRGGSLADSGTNGSDGHNEDGQTDENKDLESATITTEENILQVKNMLYTYILN